MAKSPTSVRAREIIGEEQFSQRREVFGKHDTVFLPPSPTNLNHAHKENDTVITSNHATSNSNFKRNGLGYSSMRNDDKPIVEFRQRKYSDNYTAEINQNDDVGYRQTMTERSRRLSKLRRDFLASNLHDSNDGSFKRSGSRATMPARSGPISYKIESPNIYKFPFAEPYTPTPVRKFAPETTTPNEDIENTMDKENNEPDICIQKENISSAHKIKNQQLFDDLVKRYSPQRKPVDWNLPPTKPRVVGVITKSGMTEIDGLNTENNEKNKLDAENNNVDKTIDTLSNVKKNDTADLTIPALIEKMNSDSKSLENNRLDKTKVKRKRSFIDKLLGRKKEYKNQ